jgi:CPA1 family monovalent cation:H+ antiporter
MGGEIAMVQTQTAYVVGLIVVLLLITLCVTFVTGYIRLPYTLALVVVGLVIGESHLFPTVVLSPALVLFIFLPGLLFEGAWNIDGGRLRRDWLPVTLFVIPGLLFSVAVVAAILHYAQGFGWLAALLLGAILSPTDPVAVVGLLRRMHMNKRLLTLLEGESLFNDGTASVVYQVVLAFVVGASVIPGLTLANPAGALENSVLGFLLLAGGGIGIGALIGLAASLVLPLVTDHLIETTVTAVMAYGVYLLADALHTSGILAVVAAALVLGNYGCQHGITPHAQEVIDALWEFAAFVANSLLFLLVGLQIRVVPVSHVLVPIGWTILALVVSRGVSMVLLIPASDSLVARLRKGQMGWRWLRPIPARWRTILILGGLRGALSLALVLNLPLTLPERDQLIGIVYGVVLVMLLGQGLGLRFLVPKLRMESEVEVIEDE